MRLVSLLVALALCIGSPAQNDSKAEEILARAAAAYQETACLGITFGGTYRGEMVLQGDCFYIDCAGVKSWFDGETLWSYVERNEEVNVSSPSQDDLNAVHPYAWISRYKSDFSCKYAGKKSYGGKQGDEVVLMPRQESGIQRITLCLTTDSEPVHISIYMTGGEEQSMDISGVELKRKQDISAFRFDRSRYPNAEIIELR